MSALLFSPPSPIRSMTPMYKCLRSPISLTLTLWCAREKGPKSQRKAHSRPRPRTPQKTTKQKGARHHFQFSVRRPLLRLLLLLSVLSRQTST